MAMTREDARDRLLLAMSDVMVEMLRASESDAPPPNAKVMIDNLVGYQIELLTAAPQLRGPPQRGQG